MSTRRHFLKQASFATAGLCITPHDWFSKPAPIGVQLYTVRDDINKDVRGTLAKIARLGYQQVETFGYKSGKWFGLTATELKGALKANGLTSPSGHTFPGSTFLKNGWQEDWKKACVDSKTLGQHFIVVPWLEEPYRSADNFKKVGAGLNKAGEIAQQHSLKVAYHNHDFEFAKLGNDTGFSLLMENTDPKLVSFELDLYWATKAGFDPLELFKKYPGRIKMWHVKDMDNTNKKYFTEVGNGVINFKPIFEHAKESGMQYFFVEQDFCPGPPLVSIDKSITYLRKNIIK